VEIPIEKGHLLPFKTSSRTTEELLLDYFILRVFSKLLTLLEDTDPHRNDSSSELEDTLDLVEKLSLNDQ